MEPKRVFDLIAHQLTNTPKTDAICTKKDGDWVKYSTQQVVEIVHALSYGLLEMGANVGERIGIVSANRPEWNFADLAIQKAGGIVVPMYPNIAVKDYTYIFQHSETKIVFVENEELVGKVKAATEGKGVKVFCFEETQQAPFWKTVFAEETPENKAEIEKRSANIKTDDLFTLIYTSGTTGKPKGVMLTHQNILSNVFNLVPRANLAPGQCRALSFLPLSHIFERTGVYFFMYTGTSVYYAESMEKIGDNIREVQPHFFNTVPRLLEKIYDKIVAKGKELTGVKKALFFWALDLGHQYDPLIMQNSWYRFRLKIARKLIFSKWQEALGGNVGMVCSGGAALQPRLGRVFWAAGINVCEAYGLTETSPGITTSINDEKLIRFASVGLPLEDVEIKVADDGEVLCKGINVMQGYYKEPELTAKVLRDGWFHTGDIGHIDGDGYLYITDRKKEMFKTSGGKYIAPQVLENKLKESYLISQVMVIGEGKNFPAALIVPDIEQLKKWCERHEVSITGIKDMLKNTQVLGVMEKEVAKVNEGFGRWEQIKKFKLLEAEWSVETSELTPKLSLKRRVILQKFASLVDEIYGGTDKVGAAV